jgi:hypothetical protein
VVVAEEVEMAAVTVVEMVDQDQLVLLVLLRTPGMVFLTGVEWMATKGIAPTLKALPLVQLRALGMVILTGVDSKPSTGQTVNSHLLA